MRAAFKDEDVDAEQPLWRYFKPHRLISSIITRSLYFPSARQFEDPFEGAVAVQPHDWPEDPRYDRMEGAEGAFEQLRKLTKISSWHCAGYESDAMWRLYAGDGKGVAIRTTAGRLKKALKPFRLEPEYGEEVPYWGNVRYVDLHTQRLRIGMEQRFFYKHRAFEWEREFRVAISLRTAEEFAVRVPELGIEVTYDPEALIQELFVGPFVEPEVRRQLQSVCADAGLKKEFRTSTLLGKPRYT